MYINIGYQLFKFTNLNFMDKNFKSTNNQHSEFDQNEQENPYELLLEKLKSIKKAMSLLENIHKK